MSKWKQWTTILLVVVMILQSGAGMITHAENITSDIKIDDVTSDVKSKEQHGTTLQGEQESQNEEEELTKTISRAMDWLSKNQLGEGCWGDSSLINDTCLVLSALDTENEKAVNWLNDYEVEDSVDVLSRKCVAGVDVTKNMRTLLLMQREDGGFGLNEDYESDVYDTTLALESFISVSGKEGEIKKAVAYLIKNQREDGGWSCDENTSKLMTLKVAALLCQAKYDYGIRGEKLNNALSKAAEYITEKCKLDFTDEHLYDTLHILRFLVEKNQGNNLVEYQKKLNAIQKKNGSFCNSLSETAIAVLLLRRINKKIQEKTEIDSFSLQCSPQFIYVNNEADVSVEATISYHSTYDSEYKLVTKEIVDEKEIYTEKTAITLSSQETSADITAIHFTCNEKQPKQIILSSDLCNEDGEIVEHAQTVMEVRDKPYHTEVLLIQDTLPWDCASNEVVLNNLGICFDKKTSAEAQKENLLKYRVVIVANDQSTDVYNNLFNMKQQLESFVKNGGTLVYGVCDGGWKEGQSNIYIPGNVKKVSKLARNNYIVDKQHPIVTAQYSEQTPLYTGHLTGSYTSHVSFDKTTLPDGTNVILETPDKEPTLIEYNIGKGKVIASGLTWEHDYRYKNAFGKKALDDLFLYALNLTYNSSDENPGKIESKIELNKSKYKISDLMDIKITSELSSMTRTVSGQVTVTDVSNHVVENLAQYVNVYMEVGSPIVYEISWNVENIIAGQYKIKIDWFDGEEKVGEDEKNFEILPNGLIKNKLSLSENEVSAGTTVCISDQIENASTNMIASHLEAIVSVKDSNNDLKKQFKYEINNLAANTSKRINNILETQTLEKGNYTVESRIYQSDELISSSSQKLQIVGKDITKYDISGKLEDSHGKETETIKYLIKNESQHMLDELPIKISIVDIAGEEEKDCYMNTIALSPDKKETGVYDIITSNYVSGEYVVTLYAGENYERILDSITFMVNRNSEDYLQLKYALFASDDSISINCCEANISNDIYSNGNFEFSGSILNAYDTVETTGDFATYGWIMNIANKIANVKTKSLKDYSENILGDIKKSGRQYESISMCQDNIIDIPTLCKATAGVYCSKLKLEKSLVSEEDITLNCNEATLGSPTERQVLCSLNGDITIQATKMDSYGLIYAPNGTVSINVCELNHVGSIIAKKIKLCGSYFNINHKQGE